MTLHLIRHAAAGNRSRWTGDDLDRPLDTRGSEQADAIARRLGAAPVRAVWSSLAARCIESVAPLAAVRELDVQTMRQLTEGARPSTLAEVLRNESRVEGDLVVCSHGDLIPEVLNIYLREGMTIEGPRGCAKASIWSLEASDGVITRGRYRATP